MDRKGKVSLKVGSRTVQVSSLDKAYYPEAGIIKGEVIDYYRRVAGHILRHLKGRPVALVRFPDGIGGERFFQKNRPVWAPAWVGCARLGEKKILEYVAPEDEATLVWLANMGALEIHAMMVRRSDLTHPDILAFDIDPAEDAPFRQTVEIALDLRRYLETCGYVPFAKTSGKKGIHVVVPIEPRWDVDTVFETSKKLANAFIEKTPGTTLELTKDQRHGKTLIDIYRNGPTQTMVTAYGLRGTSRATVSMPLTWEAVEALDSPSDFNLRSVPALLDQHGDAWSDLYQHATRLRA